MNVIIFLQVLNGTIVIEVNNNVAAMIKDNNLTLFFIPIPTPFQNKPHHHLALRTIFTECGIKFNPADFKSATELLKEICVKIFFSSFQHRNVSKRYTQK